MNRVLFPALLGLLLTACASTSTVRSMNVRPLAVQDIDLKGCGMTLTQPAGGTFFVADAQGAARIRLGDERVKLSRQQASGASLLLVLQERMGKGAIREFARNIGAVRHFAEIIKSLDSSDPKRLAFNILPNAASRQIPSKKRALQLEFCDGPLMAPLMLFVKRSRLEACRELLDFFWGEGMRCVLARGDFRMPDEMDWLRNYTFPSWDYLASRDFAELSEELNAEFRAGLAPGILPPQSPASDASAHSKES